ncbi:unnamed protein product, partial [Closterium sp. Yama58-4]
MASLADFLLNSRALTPDQRSLVQLLLSSAESLSQTLARLLKSPEADPEAVPESDDEDDEPPRLELRETDLHREVRECVRLMDVHAKEKGLALLCGIDSAVPQFILSDGPAIRQVLHNLIFNAVQHTDRWVNGACVCAAGCGVGPSTAPGTDWRLNRQLTQFILSDGPAIRQVLHNLIFNAVQHTDRWVEGAIQGSEGAPREATPQGQHFRSHLPGEAPITYSFLHPLSSHHSNAIPALLRGDVTVSVRLASDKEAEEHRVKQRRKDSAAVATFLESESHYLPALPSIPLPLTSQIPTPSLRGDVTVSVRLASDKEAEEHRVKQRRKDSAAVATFLESESHYLPALPSIPLPLTSQIPTPSLRGDVTVSVRLASDKEAEEHRVKQRRKDSAAVATFLERRSSSTRRGGVGMGGGVAGEDGAGREGEAGSVLLRFEVRDTGNGINAELLAALVQELEKSKPSPSSLASFLLGRPFATTGLGTVHALISHALIPAPGTAAAAALAAIAPSIAGGAAGGGGGGAGAGGGAGGGLGTFSRSSSYSSAAGVGVVGGWGAGAVQLQSEVGRGTSVVCFLPVPLASCQNITPEDLNPHQPLDMDVWTELPNARILIVDANDMHRQMALSMLRSTGVSFDVASSSQEALSLFERRPFDLVLLDCYLNGPVDGFATATLLRQLEVDIALKKHLRRSSSNRSNSSRSPSAAAAAAAEGPGTVVARACIVALTPGTGNDEEEEERCTAAGMDYFIPKPLRLRDLHMVIRHRLEVLAPYVLPGHAASLVLLEAAPSSSDDSDDEDDDDADHSNGYGKNEDSSTASNLQAWMNHLGSAAAPEAAPDGAPGFSPGAAAAAAVSAAAAAGDYEAQRLLMASAMQSLPPDLAGALQDIAGVLWELGRREEEIEEEEETGGGLAGGGRGGGGLGMGGGMGGAEQQGGEMRGMTMQEIWAQVSARERLEGTRGGNEGCSDDEGGGMGASAGARGGKTERDDESEEEDEDDEDEEEEAARQAMFGMAKSKTYTSRQYQQQLLLEDLEEQQRKGQQLGGQQQGRGHLDVGASGFGGSTSGFGGGMAAPLSPHMQAFQAAQLGLFGQFGQMDFFQAAPSGPEAAAAAALAATWPKANGGAAAMDAGGSSQGRNRRAAMLPVVFALGIVALSSALLYLQEAGSLGRGGGSNAACAVWDDKVVPLEEQMAHLDQQLAALTESIRAHQQALLDKEQLPSAATDADGAGAGADVAFGDADLARPARRVALDLVEIIGKTHMDAPRLKEMIEPMAKRVGKWVQDKVQDACQPCRPCNSTIVLVGKPCRVNAFPTTCQRRLSPAEVDDDEDLEGPSDDRVEGEGEVGGATRRRSLLGWSGEDLEGPDDDRVEGEGRDEERGAGRRSLLGWSGEDLEWPSDDRGKAGKGAREGESVCKRVSPLHAILAAESVGERRRLVKEQEERERKRPLCRDGTAAGYWKDYSTWEPYACRYREYTKKEVRACLRHKWVHFFGDSTTRHLAAEFSRLAGVQRRAWDSDKNRTALMDTGDGDENSPLPRITYLFRGKMAHQRHPIAGVPPERDLNNDFLEAFRDSNVKQPDTMVMSIGAHEVIGWTRRPPPDLDLRTFKRDTEEAIALLNSTFTRGQLVWWKAHYIWPGKVVGQDYFTVRTFHELYQAYAFRRMAQQGYTMMDLYQTTKDRYDQVFRGDGAHYVGLCLKLHVQILANTLCNHLHKS